MRPQAANPQIDFEASVLKVKAGIDIPCVPGVMPIVNTSQLLRFSVACAAEIPRWVKLRLGSYGDNKGITRSIHSGMAWLICGCDWLRSERQQS